MLSTLLKTRYLPHPVPDHVHRRLLHHHAPNSPWVVDYQGPSDSDTQLQGFQDVQVGIDRAVLACYSYCGEYAGLVPE